MKRVALLLVGLMLAGCADSRMSFNQRAHVRCLETGRGQDCSPDVMDSWTYLETQCMRRSPISQQCNAAFDREYWCRTKKRVEKITNSRGETVTKETWTEHGPGCMDSYERSKLKDAYRAECLIGAPRADDGEGAYCYCGEYGCSVTLPFYNDSVVLKYFPELK